ncbi:hypothetical protein ACEWY4_001258 [Coilia grayii]|uniref:CARD domain-containing protein n=1 Tax=Coilia grayii TaxID=363190 RepID=A0ABD1KZ18_9TELE
MDLITTAIEPVIAIAEAVYELFMKDKANQEQCQRLARCVRTLLQTLDSLQRQDDLTRHSVELRQRLVALKDTLQVAEGLMCKQESRGQLKRLLKAHKTSDRLEELYERLSDEHNQLTLLLQVEQREAAGTTIRKVEAVQEGVYEANTKVSAMYDTVDSAVKTVGGIGQKLDNSQKQMDSLHDKMCHSQRSLDELNEKVEQLIKVNPGVPSVVGPGVPSVVRPGVPSIEPKPNPGVPVTPAVPALPQDADKLLGAVRAQFVEKASLPLLKQLLDSLQDERVLNGEEAEAVLEEQSARADRARYLIDVVRKKGCKASQKMIAQLRQKDASLAETLGLA